MWIIPYMLLARWQPVINIAGQNIWLAGLTFVNHRTLSVYQNNPSPNTTYPLLGGRGEANHPIWHIHVRYPHPIPYRCVKLHIFLLYFELNYTINMYTLGYSDVSRYLLFLLFLLSTGGIPPVTCHLAVLHSEPPAVSHYPKEMQPL